MGLYWTERLLRFFFENKAIVPQFAENVLDDLGLLGRGRAAKYIELDAEPRVDLCVEGMVLCTENIRLYAFLQRFGF